MHLVSTPAPSRARRDHAGSHPFGLPGSIVRGRPGRDARPWPVRASRAWGAVLILAGGFIVAESVAFSRGPEGRPSTILGGAIGLIAGLLAWGLARRDPSRRLVAWLPVIGLFLMMLDNVADAPEGMWTDGYLLVFVWTGLWNPRGTSLRIAPVAMLALLAPLYLNGSADPIGTAVRALPMWVVIGETLAWATAALRESEGKYTAHRARADAELRRQARELEALHETTLGLLDEVNAGDVLLGTARRAGALLNTEHAYVYVVDPGTDELEVRAGTGVFVNDVGFRLRRGEGLAGRVWETGVARTVDDYGHWSGGRPEFAGLGPVIAAPMRQGNEIVGVIGVAATQPGRFTDEDVELMSQFARMASLALKHSRLLDSAQRRLLDSVSAQAAIRDSERRYRMLFESNPHPMWVYDRETFRFLAVNDAAVQHYGYPPEQFLGMTILDIRPPEEVPPLMGALITLNDQEQPVEEWKHRKRDGTVFDVEVTGRAITFGDRPARIVLATDITERRVAEEALRSGYEREHQAAERLRKVDEMKNHFLSAVSHELRTPLTSVLGYSETLRKWGTQLPELDRDQMVDRLAFNARKLDRLLVDLLDVDRMSRGILKPSLKDTDVGRLVRDVVENADSLGWRRVNVQSPPTVLKVDAAKVERIVENLLANAVRHTPAGTEFWVKTTRVNAGIVIAVEDAGGGIPAELQASIFEPFEQGSNRVEHSPGVGIGLSLVARFAELHQGRAWVEERVGGGASFRVFLREPSSVG